MRNHPESGEPPPIPGGWLPEAQPAEGAAEWDDTVARIMGAAEPTLQGLANGPRQRRNGAWRDIGSLWKPAAAVAAAALALLFTAEFPEPTAPGAARSFPLDVVVTEGDPPALWRAAGERGDPVLAFIVVQGTEAGPDGNIPSTTSGTEEER